jgi:hypothetical protein
MKRIKLTFWDFLVVSVLVVFGLSQGGASILFAVFAFLLYIFVRVLRHIHAQRRVDAVVKTLIPRFDVTDVGDRVTVSDDAVSDDSESIQKQLADARTKEQNALAEFLRYKTSYYDGLWAEAMEEVKRLEAKISKLRARQSRR